MKPRLLDLFCGAGGAARGYQLAGFHVTGVDIAAQPNYCGDEFYRHDALVFVPNVMLMGWGKPFDAIHASPPCQAYSATNALHANEYPELIGEVRDLLQHTGLPYVIENVQGAPLFNAFRLCGSSFGLGVRRHRWFEIHPMPALFVPPCAHHLQPEPVDVTGTGGPSSVPRTGNGGIHGKPRNLAHAREAMGIDWMTRPELSEAVPPAFTEFIGAAIVGSLAAVRAGTET